MERGERLSRTASVVYTKGLLNNPGENNCFLNSAVQVLWHLDVFRRSFREISGHFCVGESCIFCALKVIFTQIQYSDEAALPPDALRQALAVTFRDQQRFQLQDMDDAAECLENILNRLHFHFAMNERDEICSAAHCISHRKFAMEIMEQSICNCGATSEPLPFSQLVHYVSVSALCHEADVLRTSKFKDINQDMFGHLLKRAVNQGDVRACPGINCGKKISVQQSLLNCPDVVCVGLIWDSESPDLEQITQLLDCIDPVLRLPEVFPRVVDDTAKRVELLLAGVVTYYGKHYSTFFYSNKLNTWIYFDDARVRKCGSEWEGIRKKCCQNHYQPLLLLYVNPHGRPVNTKGALSEIKLVDTKTLLASSENSRTRSSPNEKTNNRKGSTLSVLQENGPSGDTADGLLSSSSSHSVGSDQGIEKDIEISTPERKKSKRSMKRLRVIGSDIKRALSRSRNNSPIREVDTSTGSVPTDKIEQVNGQRKDASCDDLIDLSDNPKANTTRNNYNSSSTRNRDIDEVDSGLGSGSSQASSPATSSVSSVDTTTDDLIDFTTRTFPRPSKANDVQVTVDSLVEEAESFLRRSQEYEKQDLALSLSMAANAATRFRIAIEKFPRNQSQTSYARLKEKHRACLDRSRNLHNLIDRGKNNTATTFSQQQKQKLINNQKERDQQVLRAMKQTPTVQGTLPRSSVRDRVQINEVMPMSNRSINDLCVSSSLPESKSPLTSRRTRSFHSGSIGKSRGEDFRDDANCTQRIKPDSLCYSPVHYGKTNGMNIDFERLNLAHESRDRNPTVAQVSTSFIPVRSLGVDQMLPTSTVLPNSRNLRNTDIRRCSIYDNMPPTGDPKLSLNIPQRTVIPSSYPDYHSRGPPREVGENRKWLTSPVYVDPPPYSPTRGGAHLMAKSQSGSLLQRFNVPATSRNSDTVGIPEDVRRMNESIRNSRRVCRRCHEASVEKNAILCRPCQELDSMLYNLNDTAMHY